MTPFAWILVILAFAIFFGGFGHYYDSGRYRSGGLTLGGALVILLLALLVTGNLHV